MRSGSEGDEATSAVDVAVGVDVASEVVVDPAVEVETDVVEEARIPVPVGHAADPERVPVGDDVSAVDGEHGPLVRRAPFRTVASVPEDRLDGVPARCGTVVGPTASVVMTDCWRGSVVTSVTTPVSGRVSVGGVPPSSDEQPALITSVPAPIHFSSPRRENAAPRLFGPSVVIV
ncbi:hypothetical protein C447_08965 [Halococcus hamelinensis 100A6]|uniref:Uncharacterized protein n=1 Tax=Halococcus hamelinensis 100A6 TaxID=1132509 RepID=M0LYY6_9EURY|nr:hypothetical protein C447_08965 [Halococcus hamelinensis 100A6]